MSYDRRPDRICGFIAKTKSWCNSRAGFFVVFSWTVLRWITSERSPTATLLLGLVVTFDAVVAYSWYIIFQVSGLRSVQHDLVDRNRKDSLQLVRIQNDLN